MTDVPIKKPLVAYLRVSTARQGRSGLGLEAQRAMVNAYAESNGGTVVAEFVEVESGTKGKREKLALALSYANIHEATLVVAKLDRLSRNVVFIGQLMEAGTPFVAADMPFANEMVLHMVSVMAQYEAKMISERTRAALVAARARGVCLGGYRDLGEEGNARRQEKQRACWAQKRRPVVEFVKALLGNNPSLSIRECAEILSATPEFKERTWHKTAAHRIMKEAKEEMYQ